MKWLDGIQLNGRESEQTPGDSGAQGAWHAAVRGVSELGTNQQLKNNVFLTLVMLYEYNDFSRFWVGVQFILLTQTKLLTAPHSLFTTQNAWV